MKNRILVTLLIIVNQCIGQQHHYIPTKVERDSIYARVEKIQIEKFLTSNPVLEDISEEIRDSLFLRLINEYRKSKGLNMLAYCPVLDSASALHTHWMLKEKKVAHHEYSANVDGNFYPNPVDRIKKYDSNGMYRQKIILENCGGANAAIGSDPTIQFKRIKNEHVDKIFNGWKSSPPHNAAMLDKYATNLGFNIGSRYIKKQNNFIVLGTLILSN